MNKVEAVYNLIYEFDDDELIKMYNNITTL